MVKGQCTHTMQPEQSNVHERVNGRGQGGGDPFDGFEGVTSFTIVSFVNESLKVERSDVADGSGAVGYYSTRVIEK